MVTGWYPDVKRALRKRGWHCNTDLDSPFWNLKFGLKFIDLDYDRLQPDQIVNHFDNNTQLTRKVRRAAPAQRLHPSPPPHSAPPPPLPAAGRADVQPTSPWELRGGRL